MPATRGAMLPSMVTWAPGTLCLGPGPGLTAKSNAGSDSATTASGSSTVGGNKARRRRRGSDVKSPVPSCSADGDRVSSPVPGSASASASPSADDRPAPRHEIATVEAVPGAKRDFLLKAAWTPGQLAARLLMPGACEFMGAVAQVGRFVCVCLCVAMKLCYGEGFCTVSLAFSLTLALSFSPFLPRASLRSRMLREHRKPRVGVLIKSKHVDGRQTHTRRSRIGSQHRPTQPRP